MELISIVEALLFASQEPLGVPQMCAAVKETAKDILDAASESAAAAETAGEGPQVPEWVAPLAETTEEQVRAILDELIARYESEKHSFTLVERANGWRIAARGEYAEWCRALYPGKKVQRLSQPALETLAIVAYRQPITKAGVEAVRGVSVDAMMQQLIDRGLIKIEGRADLPGRPLLYGTTEAFLDHFGVRSLDDMPNASELRRVKLPTAEEGAPAAGDQPQEQQLSLAPVTNGAETAAEETAADES
ncbi:SMC-Scp complex subunit ScpB [Prosthecobacter sp.]|uniref:SMC-Scp complex subunit ScpB n=1 Tax=Prosthecobacter sp. TaxID=1965333 RepID=UPI001DD48E59|nr:SMC-Scp complex subunit ScpB [Prosthecobacter sp.]MCB1278401.1 SMC-Scp complex subunit ScpB [Prosthecobacter sp.]